MFNDVPESSHFVHVNGKSSKLTYKERDPNEKFRHKKDFL
jgi:hypothetical protein